MSKSFRDEKLYFVKLFLKPPVVSAIRAAHGLLISFNPKVGYKPKTSSADFYRNIFVKCLEKEFKDHKFNPEEKAWQYQAADLFAYFIDKDEFYRGVLDKAFQEWHEQTCKYLPEDAKHINKKK